MQFVKMHGAGNDFLLVDARSQEQNWLVLSQAEGLALARAMCDRHFGVGADGLILVLPSQRAQLRMRVFNPDGSEAEMCGNGIRCLAKYAIERDIARPGPSGLTVETLAGVLTLLPSGADGRVDRVKASMGIPRFHPQEIPVALREGVPFDTIQPQGAVVNYPLEVDGVSLRLAFVSMGNPHAVAFLPEPVDSFPLDAVGPQVERHSLFPRRVNFEVAHLQGRGAIQARVWERGAGLTLACGSGACAIAVAARLQGLVDDQVDITLPGGTLTVQWDGQGEVWMEGPVEEVFTGEWEGV